MKVIVINASPHTDKGNTALILIPFLEGMEQAGSEVEVFYTNKLDIKPCLGDHVCWFKTPGKCIHRDDMENLLEKLCSADIWVLATPLYVDGMTGPLKNLVDRMIPLGQPVFELRDDHCRHPARENYLASKLVLVSNCGFWEMDNFDPLVSHVKAMCKNLSLEFAGALLRPHGHVLKIMQDHGAPIDDIFDAARTAGEKLITDGTIPSVTQDIISRPLLPKQEFVDRANQFINQTLNSINEK
ncbi:MAG: flavodoxin family protein [Planctomycetes bacterium]|nr:flavodoxin family protein [Planctomycetota bacterium]